MGGPQQNPSQQINADPADEDDNDDIVYVDDEILNQLDEDEEDNLVDYQGEEELKVQEQEAMVELA